MLIFLRTLALLTMLWRISMAVQAEGIEVNAVSAAGKSALIIAASAGHTGIASALLVADCIDVNAVDADGKTALIRATEAGHVDIATTLLITDGIAVDAMDKTGKTAQMHAEAGGHSDIVALIEEVQKEATMASCVSELAF